MAERQQYFRDTEDNDVDGILVIEVADDQYRVTENRESGWCKPFWMPADEFESRWMSKPSTLNSDQFMRVCQAAGVSS